MIKNLERDRLGALCCARSARTASGAFVAFGGGTGVSMRQHAMRLVLPDARPVFTLAPQTYLNGIVPPSAALHERSP